MTDPSAALQAAFASDYRIEREIGNGARLTTVGVALGTPSYMSPEYRVRVAELLDAAGDDD